MRHASAVVILVVCTVAGYARLRPAQNKSNSGPLAIVTLNPPHAEAGGRLEERDSSICFMPSCQTAGSGDWDLGYGFLAIGDEDWFQVSTAKDSRTVMKDLGALEWSGHYQVPVLEPLPELPRGQQRRIEVISGAGHEAWAATTQIFAKVMVGHIYAVHVKDETRDFYAVFRVEEHRQRDHCTISWTLVDTPLDDHQ
jgi:hypothetical protein